MELSSLLKEAEKPQILRLNLSDEEKEGGSEHAFEGGSSSDEDQQNDSQPARPKVRGKKNSKPKAIDESSADIDSGDKMSDYNLKKFKNQHANPGKPFKLDSDKGIELQLNDVEKSLIEDIPLSAFESSRSSDSSDSFESIYEEERQQNGENIRPIKVENLTDSEKSVNAGEDAMISLNDINIEPDQGLNQNRLSSSTNKSFNGQDLRYIRTKEKEVKLFTDNGSNEYDEESSLLKSRKFNSKRGIESLNSMNEQKIAAFRAETYLESHMRLLEGKLINAETGKYDVEKLRPFMRDYITNENRVQEAKMILDELLKTAEDFKRKLKEDILKEHNKQEQHDKKEKALMETVKTNIHKGKVMNKILKSRRKTGATQNMNMVHPGHENFNLVFNIMLGIKKAIDAVVDFPFIEEVQK
uniref:Uncharacterized protein n=1 Tax=Euplotes harpa TaxID=151035 RepID=A0A7S3NC99_9SPIT|mmetsp:Transcript_30492/g.34917  ORF Transcript_30492/g.34917 Transcript_30492/m.34917 type:complete len:414 (+) Transcript_30492:942-2183(+)